MASRWFILNEWILHDLVGENGVVKQKQSGDFLSALLESPDGIVVYFASQWMRKLWNFYSRNSQGDTYRTEERRLFTLLYTDIIRHSRKCRGLLNEHIGDLPDDLQSLLDSNTIDRDDTYLFQTFFAPGVQAECIVTTDQRLIDAIDESPLNVSTIHRDDFLDDYLASTPAP